MEEEYFPVISMSQATSGRESPSNTTSDELLTKAENHHEICSRPIQFTNDDETHTIKIIKGETLSAPSSPIHNNFLEVKSPVTMINPQCIQITEFITNTSDSEEEEELYHVSFY